MRRLLLAFLFVLFAAPAWAGNVGFRLVEVTGGPTPLKVGVWYPTEATMGQQRLGLYTQEVAAGAPVTGHGLPLVVISHGTGGWLASHLDTARALAEHGYVVAAVSHAGDTYDDRSASTRPWIRTAQIKAVIDYMLTDWPDHGLIDAERVGFFGFSAGGLTGLAVIGGQPDMRTMAPHCRAHPTFFDCRLVARAGVDLETLTPPPASVWVADHRIKAAVIAEPGLGFAFRNGLKGVAIPVQLWRAEFDATLPESEASPLYALAAREGLPKPPDYHVADGADHFDFLAPCSPAMATENGDICKSRPGFDRAAFHAQLNAEITAFFDRTLR
jgi:predicted dienelactone hydrolase